MNRSVLVVDDDVDILGVVAEYLGYQGWDVGVAHSGRVALEMLRQEPARFSTAMVDWSLHDLTGRELMFQIREEFPACKLIVLTGHGKDIVSDGYAGQLAFSIVRKPFTLRALARELERAAS